MVDARVDETDEAPPSEIEHKCEEIFEGTRLLQRYNYLVYHFERDGRYFWARSYLDDIQRVSVHGPFDSRKAMKVVPGSIDEVVFAYLRRRYPRVETLGGAGYVEAKGKK